MTGRTITTAICALMLSIPVAKAADIVDRAAAAGTFNTFLEAVKAADLHETLKGAGPFTVFAPTDAAFAKLPEGMLENLMRPENKNDLIDMIAYHVVPDHVLWASGADQQTTVQSLQGRHVWIDAIEGGGMKVDNAEVIAPDLQASNGVIHGIDTVITLKTPAADVEEVDRL
jgi:uncharacterized surface protein with fasciclin (FAS1) repeats